MRMPIKRFWLFSESIDRLNSAQDIRAIRVAASVLDKESYTDTMTKLTDSVGEIAAHEIDPAANFDAHRDQDATDRLRSLM